MNYVILAGVALISIPVVANMFSARQIMNTNFNSLHLVGTYGAFGSITKTRYEVIVEGTDDSVLHQPPNGVSISSRESPAIRLTGPPDCAVSSRLDWLMWFAAMSSYQDYPWFVNLVAKLLQGDGSVLSLLRSKSLRRQTATLCSCNALRISLHHARRTSQDRSLVAPHVCPVPISLRCLSILQGSVTYSQSRVGFLSKNGITRRVIPFASQSMSSAVTFVRRF